MCGACFDFCSRVNCNAHRVARTQSDSSDDDTPTLGRPGLPAEASSDSEDEEEVLVEDEEERCLKAIRGGKRPRRTKLRDGRTLPDVLDAVERRGGHWAFYALREDEWEGMDYELPTDMKPGRFYWLMEEGRGDELPRDGELMELLRDHLKS